ncbi:MAG: S8 family serine peptidase [Nitrosopumilus sp. (ex Thoosa mismalolli)]|nr:S8 family serine peptidase [Nitrosopumilus sp. (ex Thoosa mismalolli)]
MDSGVNPIKPLVPVLKNIDAYNFQNFSDQKGKSGHGTTIAHLIAFGEQSGSPTANIISYKIWSDQERKWAFRGLINGIKKYSSETRLFSTSIGIPFLTMAETMELDKLIQEKNILLISSAGNIEPDQLKEILRSSAYPNYIGFVSVIPPSIGLNVVSVGSITKKTSDKFQSLAKINQISPHATCDKSGVELYECKKLG